MGQRTDAPSRNADLGRPCVVYVGGRDVPHGNPFDSWDPQLRFQVGEQAPSMNPGSHADRG